VEIDDVLALFVDFIIGGPVLGVWGAYFRDGRDPRFHEGETVFVGSFL
jgi:hypothetical protein